MPTIVLRHKVGNYDTWLKGHEDRNMVFSQAGTGFTTFRDQEDPNTVTLVVEVTDLDKFQSLFTDPEVQKLKDKHTVIDPISISMPVDI